MGGADAARHDGGLVQVRPDHDQRGGIYNYKCGYFLEILRLACTTGSGEPFKPAGQLESQRRSRRVCRCPDIAGTRSLARQVPGRAQPLARPSSTRGSSNLNVRGADAGRKRLMPAGLE
jgi:hypothetical protein